MYSCLNHILSFDEQDFELIIQDNSDTTRILDYLKKNQDSRLKYNYLPERINSVKNMDYAISMAKEYITMIGDDDTFFLLFLIWLNLQINLVMMQSRKM